MVEKYMYILSSIMLNGIQKKNGEGQWISSDIVEEKCSQVQVSAEQFSFLCSSLVPFEELYIRQKIMIIDAEKAPSQQPLPFTPEVHVCSCFIYIYFSVNEDICFLTTHPDSTLPFSTPQRLPGTLKKRRQLLAATLQLK